MGGRVLGAQGAVGLAAPRSMRPCARRSKNTSVMRAAVHWLKGVPCAGNMKPWMPRMAMEWPTTRGPRCWREGVGLSPRSTSRPSLRRSCVAGRGRRPAGDVEDDVEHLAPGDRRDLGPRLGRAMRRCGGVMRPARGRAGRPRVDRHDPPRARDREVLHDKLAEDAEPDDAHAFAELQPRPAHAQLRSAGERCPGGVAVGDAPGTGKACSAGVSDTCRCGPHVVTRSPVGRRRRRAHAFDLGHHRVAGREGEGDVVLPEGPGIAFATEAEALGAPADERFQRAAAQFPRPRRRDGSRVRATSGGGKVTFRLSSVSQVHRAHLAHTLVGFLKRKQGWRHSLPVSLGGRSKVLVCLATTKHAVATATEIPHPDPSRSLSSDNTDQICATRTGRSRGLGRSLAREEGPRRSATKAETGHTASRQAG
jgi:hypothetical protein